jgi:guanidinobutyrase
VQGWWVVQAEECWHKSMIPLMDKIRNIMANTPIYLSFDIDAIGQSPTT